MRRFSFAAFGLLTACGGAEPPGAVMGEVEPEPSLPLPASTPDEVRPAVAADPFPDKLLSVAMRTWIYQLPGPDATKLGYLRAGAVVARAHASAGTDDCDGGWYAVEPRGFVCAGKGASLELNHPIAQAIPRPPVRDGRSAPYQYVISREPAPHRYFRLPTVEEQKRAEGKRRERSIALYTDALARLGAAAELPSFLASGEPLPKPYGAERDLSYAVHRGRANPDSAFGLLAHFDWEGRRMGLTTELDLIPLDRTRVAVESRMVGRVVAPDESGTPALVYGEGVKRYERNERGKYVARGQVPHRSGWLLTGERGGGPHGFAETSEGSWLPLDNLRIAEVRADHAGFAAAGRKWIDISIKRQMLVAYEGVRPVFFTLISSGRGEMGDPAETSATVRGSYMIHAKHLSGTMDGDETTEDSFDLRDVPYIQYFYQGYALHGAYWHDDFGKPRSHGCINLSPRDAAWLFEWTEPQVPETWHGARNLNAGTLVDIHR